MKNIVGNDGFMFDENSTIPPQESIRVKETKVKLVSGLTDFVNVPVAEGKLVLVECKPEEALFFKFEGDVCPTYYGYNTSRIKGIGKYFNPIIISETEKIDKDNYFLNLKTNRIFINDLGLEISNETEKKILTLPEHFSPKQLQMIVDGKLKDGDKVLVECEYNRGEFSHYSQDLMKIAVYNNTFWFIKLNTQSHITLHKIEEKMYTSLEVIEMIAASDLHESVEEAKKEFPHLFASRKLKAKNWFEKQNIK